MNDLVQRSEDNIERLEQTAWRLVHIIEKRESEPRVSTISYASDERMCERPLPPVRVWLCDRGFVGRFRPVVTTPGGPIDGMELAFDDEAAEDYLCAFLIDVEEVVYGPDCTVLGSLHRNDPAVENLPSLIFDAIVPTVLQSVVFAPSRQEARQ